MKGTITVSEIEKLVNLQALDNRIQIAEKELKDIPARKDLETRRLQEHKAGLAAAEETLKGLQAQIRQRETEIEGNRDKIAKLRTQQMQLKTNKEFKAMDMEIETVGHGILDIEDGIIVLMESVEKARNDVQARRQELDAEATAVARDHKELDERQARIEAVLNAEKAERAKIAATVASAWLGPYETILSRKTVALVPVEDGVCGGCHMKLPPYLVHNARKHNGAVFCGFCGRMLY